MSENARPIGGPLLTRPYMVLLALSALGVILIAWRFAAGLGATTALNDGYPWGLWIALDVVTGTALACGGYAMALVVYILNKGKYHPLVRPAILTSALGYTIAGVSVAIDVGRPWLMWKVPLFFTRWNVSSALLEVALCIMAYVMVLWIELSPAFLERWREGDNQKLRRFAEKTLPFMNKALIWIIALGLLLPTMHQSSLGALMMLSGPRLHPLWQTPLLPLFFLVTVLAVGYAAVIFESLLSAMGFAHRPDKKMLAALQKVAAWTGVGFVVARFVDLAFRGTLAWTITGDLYSIMFWVETVLFLVPAALMLSSRRAPDSGDLLRSATFVALAGAFYRFDTFLVAFDPGPGWHYFPSVPEILISVGLISMEIAVYIAVVKRFPILAGHSPRPATGRAEAPARPEVSAPVAPSPAR